MRSCLSCDEYMCVLLWCFRMNVWSVKGNIYNRILFWVAKMTCQSSVVVFSLSVLSLENVVEFWLKLYTHPRIQSSVWSLKQDALELTISPLIWPTNGWSRSQQVSHSLALTSIQSIPSLGRTQQSYSVVVKWGFQVDWQWDSVDWHRAGLSLKGSPLGSTSKATIQGRWIWSCVRHVTEMPGVEPVVSIATDPGTS